MGYCISVRVNDVVIPSNKVEGAINAMKLLMGKVWERGSGGAWYRGKKTAAHYSWTDTAVVVEALGRGSLVDALDEWRWGAGVRSVSDLEALAHGGHQTVEVYHFQGEKSGDEEQLWGVLAPFISNGGSIEFEGEDGALWRYLFRDGEMIEQAGEIKWG